MTNVARNAVARDLATRKYSMRIVAKTKGKGSYRRNKKHRSENRGGVSSFLSCCRRYPRIGRWNSRVVFGQYLRH